MDDRNKVSNVQARIGVADVVSSNAKGPQNWGWVQATLRLIDERVPGSGIVLRFVTYDVYQYLGNPGIRIIFIGDSNTKRAFVVDRSSSSFFNCSLKFGSPSGPAKDSLVP